MNSDGVMMMGRSDALKGAIKDDMMLTLARRCEDAGWRIEVGKTHVKAYPPDGTKWVSFPKSPSDHRAWLNKRAELRRLGVPGIGPDEDPGGKEPNVGDGLDG